jgi:NAD(P)-dependent dehydrogenase (short-subunit alcohol dehydrogenase family)
MIAQKSGKIVNISSVSALVGIVKGVNYSAAKAAIIGFTKGLAREVGGYGINVNVVCPGTVFPARMEDTGEKSAFRDPNFLPWQTPEFVEAAIKRCPMARLGTPEDVADAVVFLASEAANYITGHVLTVDGGWTMA